MVVGLQSLAITGKSISTPRGGFAEAKQVLVPVDDDSDEEIVLNFKTKGRPSLHRKGSSGLASALNDASDEDEIYFGPVSQKEIDRKRRVLGGRRHTSIFKVSRSVCLTMYESSSPSVDNDGPQQDNPTSKEANADELKASLMVQRCVRRFLGTKRANQSATVVQKHWRRHAQKQRYHALFAASLNIQKNARRHISQTRFRQAKHGALTIQTHWRSIVERRKLKAMKIVSSFLQKTWRMRTERAHFADQRSASIVLQSHYRGMIARRTLTHLKLTNTSAISLQSAWRGAKERNNYVGMRKASVAVQASWRRYSAVRQLNNKRRATSIVQKNMRSFLCRKRYDAMRLAAARISALVKGCRQRAMHLRLRQAAISCQSHVRRNMARRNFLATKAASEAIRFWFAARKIRGDFLTMRKSAGLIQKRVRLMQLRQKSARCIQLHARAWMRKLQEEKKRLEEENEAKREREAKAFQDKMSMLTELWAQKPKSSDEKMEFLKEQFTKRIELLRHHKITPAAPTEVSDKISQPTSEEEPVPVPAPLSNGPQASTTTTSSSSASTIDILKEKRRQLEQVRTARLKLKLQEISGGKPQASEAAAAPADAPSAEVAADDPMDIDEGSKDVAEPVTTRKDDPISEALEQQVTALFNASPTELALITRQNTQLNSGESSIDPPIDDEPPVSNRPKRSITWADSMDMSLEDDESYDREPSDADASSTKTIMRRRRSLPSTIAIPSKPKFRTGALRVRACALTSR